MTDILLGQAYHLRFDPKLWRAMEPYPPLGTLYAAAVLRRCGYTVALHDSMLAESVREWTAALDRVRPRYAILYEDNFNYLSKMCLLRMRDAAMHMIASAGERGCTTIVCGADATDHYADYLEGGVDYVLLGEGEETLQQLLDSLEGRSHVDLKDIQGIAYVEDGQVVTTPRRPVIRRLDDLPRPAWDLVDVERYRRIWLERHGYFSINMITSRGCPFHCNWFAKPIWGQRYNARSPQNVADELTWLRDHLQASHIWFMDDMMGIKPGWMASFADIVEAQGIRTPFKCLNRVDLLLRDGEIDALRRAGCRTVWTGVESGSQKILDAMDKGIRVEQIREAADRLHEAHIQVGFFIQFGYPGETREDIAMTFDLIRRCRPDQIGVSVSYPLPGTKFYDSVREELGKKQNWLDSNDLAMLHAGAFSTSFYRRLHRVLHKEFRARKAYHVLRKQFSARTRPAAKHAREVAALLYNAATLPLERLKMERAARRPNENPHASLGEFRGSLPPEAASVPTPQ